MECAFALATASAGKSSDARIAMIAMTTSSSIKVKPRRLLTSVFIPKKWCSINIRNFVKEKNFSWSSVGDFAFEASRIWRRFCRRAPRFAKRTSSAGHLNGGTWEVNARGRAQTFNCSPNLSAGDTWEHLVCHLIVAFDPFQIVYFSSLWWW